MAFLGLLACGVAQAQIADKPLAERSERIQRVQLLAPGAGLIITRSRLLLTEDNGNTWSDRTPPIAGKPEILDVQFRDPRAGRLLFSTSEGSIRVGTTTDGGWHWTVSIVKSLAKSDWEAFAGTASLSFADDQHGWVMLGRLSSSNFSVGSLLATSDGGNTWNALPDPPAGDPIVFVTPTDGWMAAGPAYTDLYVTRDAGRTWQAVPIHQRGDQPAKAFRYDLPRFADPRHGYVLVHTDAAIHTYRTQDGGHSWQAAGFNVLDEGAFATPIVSGGYSRLRTLAKAAYLGSEESLLQSDFLDDRNGWLLGASGACDGAGECRWNTRLLAVAEGEAVTDITPPDLRSGENSSRVSSPKLARVAFDKCSTPAIGQMQTWWTSSPYDSLNVYLGGVSAACSPPDSEWLNQVHGMGWTLIPTWVGPQAPCSGFSQRMSSSTSVAELQGAGEANAAADAAASFGLTNTVVFYDMESYDAGNSLCSAAAQAFITGWVRQMHARGNLAGMYGSASAAADWANAPLPPDAIRQYSGGRTETYGGVALTIHSDIANGPMAGGIARQTASTRRAADNGDGMILGPASTSRRIGGSGTANAAAQAGAGFKINVTYGNNVPAAMQTAFNSVVNTYQGLFNNNVTVNLTVNGDPTDNTFGSSFTQLIFTQYSTWRAAAIANANANPGNTYAAAAAASLPANDPIGDGNVLVRTANARALGLSGNVASDSTLTFGTGFNWEYNGVASPGKYDFLDVAAHELDEALGIGSSLTGIADNGGLPSSFEAQDFFRYSAPNTRAITTNPAANVYFSYNGGSANVAQFNQVNNNGDRNDWIYGNFGCPANPVYIQDARACSNQAAPVGSGPEVIVLNALGYNPIPTVVLLQQTWVSGNGADTNACDRATPCKTFAGAISKTVAGGEIDCLDPGEFGTLTITKAITIDCGGGDGAFPGSVQASGTSGIVVQAPSNASVTLRNIAFQGNGGQGVSGIQFLSGGYLHIQHVQINGFSQNGIDVNNPAFALATVRNSVIGEIGQAGVNVVYPASGAVSLDSVQISNAATGVHAGTNAKVMLTRTTIMGTQGGSSIGVKADTGGAAINIDSTLIAFCSTGVSASGGGNVFLANSSINNNATGVSGNVSNSIPFTNTFFNNTSNGAFGGGAITLK